MANLIEKLLENERRLQGTLERLGIAEPPLPCVSEAVLSGMIFILQGGAVDVITDEQREVANRYFRLLREHPIGAEVKGELLEAQRAFLALGLFPISSELKAAQRAIKCLSYAQLSVPAPFVQMSIERAAEFACDWDEPAVLFMYSEARSEVGQPLLLRIDVESRKEAEDYLSLALTQMQRPDWWEVGLFVKEETCSVSGVSSPQ